MSDHIKYFDCFAAIGKYGSKDPEAPWTTEQLLSEMQRCQVNAALVYAHQARETHPLVGNPIVSEICKENPRLFPCWVALPHHTLEMPAPGKLVQQMVDEGVKALKIYPRIFEFPVDEITLGPLLDAVQEAGILLIADAGRYGDAIQLEWPEVSWICDNYPKLKLLLHSVRWEATRTLTPLAEQFENLYFEFSNYQGNRMLEFWCERIGHHRLLFGSEAMIKSMGAARAYIDYADINDEQRKAIAGGNLMKLLGVTELPDLEKTPPVKDAILETALKRQPVTDMVVIDSHAHNTKAGTRGASRVAMNDADAASVVERNRKIGVNKTCISSWTAIWGDYELGNLDTLEAKNNMPDEIVGYAVLDPNYITDWDKELKYWHEECGFPGMKPYFPRMGIPYNDKLFDPWYEYANKRNLFCLLHYSNNFEAEVSDIAERFPNIKFFLAHSGTSWEVARRHVRLAKKYANVYCEITFTAVLNGSIEYMVREVGSERVLYGSDAPMRDPFPQFGWLAYADISEEDKRNILGRNMQRILEQVKLKAR